MHNQQQVSTTNNRMNFSIDRCSAEFVILYNLISSNRANVLVGLPLREKIPDALPRTDGMVLSTTLPLLLLPPYNLINTHPTKPVASPYQLPQTIQDYRSDYDAERISSACPR